MGGMDSYVAALGMGVVRPRRLCTSFGSSSAFVVSADNGLPGRMYGPMRFILPGAAGYWHGGQSTVGLAVDWVKKLFRRSDMSLELDASLIPPGSGGLLFRETLVDRRSPSPRADMRGRWEGLSLEHGPAALFRSVLEGIAFGARYSLESIDAREVVVTGGLAKSDLFLQILADVLEQPISRVRHRETAAFGAAFAHEPERIPELNPVVETIQPVGTNYREVYARYRDLHECEPVEAAV